MLNRPVQETSSAYRWGAATLLLATAAILTALGFEHIGGYAPCPLCLMQRWAYYAAIPVTFLGLVASSADRPRWAASIFLLVSLAFLANAGLGIYHAGAEWKYWPGPQSCAAAQDLAMDVGGLLESLPATVVVRCDEAAVRYLGLSFAGWNVVGSFVLFALALKAAAAAVDPSRRNQLISNK